MIKDSHRKSGVKSLVWRFIGVFWLATITWIFTRNMIQTTLTTFIHHTVFLVIFYLHERVWLCSKMRVRFKYAVKAITYEVILGNVILGIISYLVTGNVYQMTQITFVYIQSKIILYYFYDWFWSEMIWKK